VPCIVLAILFFCCFACYPWYHSGLVAQKLCEQSESSIHKEEKHVDNRTGSLLYKPGFRIALVNATA
jgi:hypothetical protein